MGNFVLNIKVKGIDTYISQLENIEGSTEKMIGEAIHKGAKIVADKTKSALKGLPVDNSTRTAYRTSINTKQKEGLIESFGIAPLRDDKGFKNVKTGFDGYNEIVTKQWPKGQPNQMIARALESGTSFMPKRNVITQATKESKKACQEAMKKCIESYYKNIKL